MSTLYSFPIRSSIALWRSIVLLFGTCCLSLPSLQAQCTNGTQADCKCTTAPVLCTIDELDQYEFSMTSFQHPQDGPSPLCPPQQGTVSNNPTWFAFVAWCTELTLLVEVENCTPFQGGTNGVQIAIYSSCNIQNPDPVACNTDASDCNTDDKILEMDNLVIGNTYYFLIDGCAGAYCDVSIDVVGVCGEAEISPWAEDVQGPTEICAGSSEVFSVESLHGATHYHWYLNGMLTSEGLEMTNFSQVWSTPGTYEICVDASNIPCIPEEEDPEPNCVTVEVFDANAGMITATPTPVCPEDIVTITATGFQSDTDYDQYIVIADASGIIVDVTDGSSTTFTHDECASFTAYSYNIHPASGNQPPEVGDNVSSLNCNDGCCDSETAPFEFEDTVNPVLLNAPANLNLNCYSLLTPMPALTWTDNCDGTGSVSGEENGSADLCDGGVITRTWEYIDQCGNSVTHIQTITILAMPPASFMNPPADITVDCASIPATAPALIAMNSGMGGCAISSMVNATQNGMADACGGSFSFVWEFTDVCDRTITHTQNITVTPIAPPVFAPVNADTTVQCDAIPTSVPNLNYSNGQMGPCGLNGSVPGTIDGQADLCGGNIRFSWTYTDACGRKIDATRNFQVLPVPEATFTNSPADVTITCDQIPASFPSLTYTNGGSGACLISGTVVPVVQNNVTACGGSINVTWQTSDPCGRAITLTQVVTVMPAPPPQWINPPGDTTIDCSTLPSNIPSLAYSNGQSGVCAISGTVPGVQISIDVCAGLVQWQWQFTDACGNTITHTRNINTNPPPPVVFLNPPPDVTVSCLEFPFMTVPDLSYTNNASGACLTSGTVPGVASSTWEFCGAHATWQWTVTDQCGVVYSYTRNIYVEPAPPMLWQNPPGDTEMICDDIPLEPPLLTAWNGMPMGPCAQIIATPAVQTGEYSGCGGEVIYTWTWVEFCGDTLQHVQHITVLPSEPPVFNNDILPNVIGLNCWEVADIPIELEFSNGSAGPCLIQGTDSADIAGVWGPCPGPLTFFWEATDTCGNEISLTRMYQLYPTADPDWVDPPANDTVPCYGEYLPPEPLQITNGMPPGPCSIDTFIEPEVIFDNDTYIHTWSFYYSCTDSLIEYVQYVYDYPEPEMEIEPAHVTICYADSFNLSSVSVVDLNGDTLIITYHTDSPPDATNQLGSPVIVGDEDTEYIFKVTNSVGCTDEGVFEVFVLPLPDAGEDINATICQTETVDFENLIESDVDVPGTWLDVDGVGIDLDNINSVSFQNIEPGTYHFIYYVSINACPADSSIVTIHLNGPPVFSVDSVFCNGAHTEYTVVILGTNLQVDPSHGTVVMIPGGLQIVGIPIEEQLTFDIYDQQIQCFYTFDISPPNCDCPNVPAPVNNGDLEICVGSPTPVLSVTVDPGYTANWYTTQVGGTSIATGTTTYLPVESAPGVYVFYVEAESIETPGCVSNVRTPVTLEIHDLPLVNDLQLAFCDDAETGMLAVDLADWASSISGNLQATITFHSTAGEAENGTNPLAMPVTIAMGSQVYFASVLDLNGCIAVAEIQATLHPLPDFGVQISHETCAGNNDGSFTITGLNSSEQYNLVVHGTQYTDVFQFGPLAPGTYPVSVTQVSTTCTQSATVTINSGLLPAIGTPVLNCNDNDTDTDPADDYYVISTTVSSPGSTQIFELFVNGSSQGYFAYGQVTSFQLPASGMSAILVATDTTYGCSDTLNTSLLNPCSSACDLFLDDFTQTCHDNGTPIDPSDDYHTITLNVSAVNGSASNQYFVNFDGVLESINTYGVPESFDLPVSEPLPAVQLQDASDAQCFLNLDLDPLISCSSLCTIPVPDVQYTCSDNGTPDESSDDYYTVIFVAAITNPGPSNMAVIRVDGAIATTVVAGTEVELELPADGMIHTLEIADADNAGCSHTWTTILFQPCSTLCIISAEEASIDCNDNGTPTDPGDDFYAISWTANAVFGSGALTYRILIDGVQNGTGAYGVDQSITLPADGTLHTLVLQDTEDPNCQYPIPLPVLTHCSDACSIAANILQIYCDNQGTNQTETDDVFFVVIEVSGENIGSNIWTTEGHPYSGTLGEIDTIGPFLIADGNQQITFNGNDGSCTDEILANAPPACSSCEQSVSASADAVLDCGMPSAQLTVTSSHPGTATWLDPGGQVVDGETITVSIPGEYIATVSYPDGCAFSDTVQVTADPLLPSVWAGPDMILNCEIREVTLIAEVLSGNPGVDFEWTNAAGAVLTTDQSLTVNTPGIYFVRIYDAGVDCWSGQDAVEVIDVSNEPSAVIFAHPGSQISCVVQSIELTTANQVNVSYVWSFRGQMIPGNTLVIEGAGTVVLTAIDTITHCESMDSIDITGLIEYPVIQIAPVEPLSCGNPSVVIDASGSFPSSGVDYFWTDTSGNSLGSTSILSVSEPGSFILQIIDPANGCSASDTVEVIDISVIPQLASLEDAQLTCDVTSGVLNASLEEPLAGVVFNWMTPSGTMQGQQITYAVPGTFIVTATHSASQCADADTIIVLAVSDFPQAIAAQTMETSCIDVEDGMISFGAITGGSPPYSIFVDGIEISGTTLTGLQAGTYTIQVEDSNGCVLDTAVTVLIGDEVIVDLETQVTIRPGQDHVFMAGVNVPESEIESVVWTPSESLTCDTCLTTQATPSQTTMYTIAVTDVYGCTGEAHVTIHVIDEDEIFVPNVISPNGDQVNDYLTLFTNELNARIRTMRIFNRWGALVFEKFDFAPNIPSEGWDGTFKDQPLNPAVFVYMFELVEEGGDIEIIKGDVTIIR